MKREWMLRSLENPDSNLSAYTALGSRYKSCVRPEKEDFKARQLQPFHQSEKEKNFSRDSVEIALKIAEISYQRMNRSTTLETCLKKRG